MSRPRTFDWDEAARLRREGWTLAALAARYGVSDSAVSQATNTRSRERMAAQHAVWQRQGRCVDCGGPCTRNSTHPILRCRSCDAKLRATTVRPDTLLCATCREWKPDDLFPRSRPTRQRRCRHTQCRACLTEVKRVYRESRKVPCERCGCPRLPASESSGGRYGDTGLCLACYRARDQVAA